VTSAIKKQAISTFDHLAKQSKIDILVNNARISQIGNVEATPEDAFDRIIRVNVKGYYNCIYVCIGIRVNAIVPAEVMTPLYRRFCLILDLKDDLALIAEYRRYHVRDGSSDLSVLHRPAVLRAK